MKQSENETIKVVMDGGEHWPNTEDNARCKKILKLLELFFQMPCKVLVVANQWN